MSDVEVLIIGAGPTGLGAAWQLSRHQNIEWLVVEQEPVVGGLSRSIVDDAGYTWDVGGHVCFSHYDVFSAVLERAMGTDVNMHTREAWIRAHGSWVPYPFQNNLHRLPAEVRDRCLAGLIEAAIECGATTTGDLDFARFIHATFGQGIADEFMVPYNQKVWAHPLDEMSSAWVGERVSVPDPVRAVTNALHGRDDVGWGPNDLFGYPRTGGTGALWEAVAALLPPDRLRTGTKVVRIDADAHQAVLADGTTLTYGSLITAAPLDATARMLGDAELVAAARSLSRTSTHVVGLGVDAAVSERLGTRCWMYFPQPEVPFYRTTNFSHYSPQLAPQGKGSLLVEVAETIHAPVDADKLPDDVIAGLLREGLLEDAAEVEHVWAYRAEHGYPVPTLARDRIVGPALTRLRERNIFSRGRFGAWRYEVGNMDHCFMQGYEAAARIITGSAELTVWNPELVNHPHPVMGRQRIL